jgi:alkylation response protein AidB-like acyl-CoA dehydrogenase
MTTEQIISEVGALSSEFAADRASRMTRRHLERSDFERLSEIGLPLLAVPESHGGTFRSLAESVRGICEAQRALAAGDPSVALVTAMHPAVLAFWLGTPEVPGEAARGWAEQRAAIFAGARSGCWWGTISSEPGSGGDHRRTKSVARSHEGRWLVSGNKHFGSGSGMTSYMLTTAVPEGEDVADWFFVRTEGMPWDGSQGVRMVREWDGRGMRATQSHAMNFDDVEAERIAWPGHLDELRANAASFGPTVFTAVITGVVDAAMAAARERVGASVSGFTAMEWADARIEAWTLTQVLDGMIRSVEEGGDSLVAMQGKVMASRLAESVTARLCRVIGGSTFSESNQFGQWAEDVRALGFLRPPWALMYEALT